MLATAEADGQKPHLTPRYVSYQMGQVLPSEAAILHELVDSSLFNRTLPGTLLGTGGSHIGWSAPAAVGVKVAAPDRLVVAAVGDGSWMFANPQVSVWASRFHRAPVLFVVFNNRGYRTGTEGVRETYPEGHATRAQDFPGGWFDPTPEFAAEAAASDAFGEKVSRPEDVAPALRRGIEAVSRGTPAVLEFWLPKLITGEVE
jgi:acetolactate synthase-1/2/3 large subunit